MSRLTAHILLGLFALLLAVALADRIRTREVRAERSAPIPIAQSTPETAGAREPSGSLARQTPVYAVPRIAVLDFRRAENEDLSDVPKNQEADPWSFGLADFVSAALEAEGLRVYERRAMRALLEERALQSSGFVAEREAIRAALPPLRFLVSGSIEAQGPGRFRLSLSALDTQEGRVTAELSAAGRYPEELAEALGALAVRLATALKASDQKPPEVRRAAPTGFTRNPDVAVQFYKGLDHLVHGRPEFAAEYFRQAHLADPEFSVALAWRMRAYEALGLHDLARYVRSSLLASPRGHEVFQLVAPSLAHDRGRLVVAVPRANDSTRNLRDLESQVANLLAERSEIDLFSAPWIRGLADELDLRLSGEISPYSIESQAWLAADLVVRLAQEGSGRARIDLIDTLSGTRIAGADIASGKGVRPAVERLLKDLERRKGQEGSPQPWRLRALRPLDYTLPEGDIATYTRQGYAYLLRDFALQPHDPVRIARHAEVHGLHSYANHEPDIYDREWGYLELLWQRLIESVDHKDPAAPNWLSLALWKLRLHGNYNGDSDSPNWWYNRGKRVPGIEEHFAPLLQRYPDSLAALCVRYSLALEHAMWGRHEQAAAILLDLAERSHEEGDLVLDYGATANLFTVASIEADTVGRERASSRFAELANLHAERFTHFLNPKYFEGGRPIGGRDHPVEPVIPAVLYTPPGRGGHAEGQWFVGSMPKTVFVEGRVRFMRAEPMNGEIARIASGASSTAVAPPLGAQYRAAIALTGSAGVAARLAYMQRLTYEIQQGTPVSMSDHYGRPEDTILPWLRDALPENQRQAFEAVVEEFVTAIRERGYLRDELILNLYVAAGMDDAVLVLAESATKSQRASERRLGAVAKAGVLTRQQGPQVAARYLTGELKRFERDFESQRATDYLDLVHATGRALEAAGELGAGAAVYARALATPLFPDSGSDGPARVLHHHTSLRYLLAALEVKRGNDFEAASLLKRVIESSEPHPDWLLHYSGRGARSIGTRSLYQAALRDLAGLRAPAAPHP